MPQGARGHILGPARSAARDLWRSVKNAGYGSPLYGYTLRGRHPNHLMVVPQDPWPGNTDTGNALFRGEYAFAGQTIHAPNEVPWALEGATGPWLEALHGFDWLRHFRACGGDAAKRHVQALIGSWLETHADWDSFAWQPHLVASRITAWMRHEPLTISSPDLVYRSAVMNSIARQTRHLTRAWPAAKNGLERLTAISGIVYGGLCLRDGAKRLARGLDLMSEALDQFVLPDGGFITRSPSDHLTALKLLISLRDTLLAANHDHAIEVQKAIDRMVPMLRFFRHGDGGLALFNGGFEEQGEIVGLALKCAHSRGRAPGHGADIGYHSLIAGPVKVVIDTGPPPTGDLSRRAHAGVLGFEMSVGKERLIVNCGSVERARAGPAWDRVCRSSAAHSTLVIDNRNSCVIRENGCIGARPAQVEVAREEAEGATWVNASHDGYRPGYGLVHHRRLYLNATGDDLRGEDRIDGPGLERRLGLPFDIRFHIHPAVTCSIVQNGESVLMRMRRRGGWRFQARGGEISVAESVYLGRGGDSRRCDQIVVSGKLGATAAVVNWSIKHI